MLSSKYKTRDILIQILCCKEHTIFILLLLRILLFCKILHIIKKMRMDFKFKFNEMFFVFLFCRPMIGLRFWNNL